MSTRQTLLFSNPALDFSDKYCGKLDVQINEIPIEIATKLIEEGHYSHKMPQAIKAYYGCFYKNVLMGVIIYSVPSNQHAFNFTEEVDNNTGLELSRMWTDDRCPQNFETCSIGKSIKKLKEEQPNLNGLVSYADPHYGHSGKIYVASNWKLIGKTSSEKRYLMPNGELITRRGLGRREGESEKENRERLLKEGATEFLSEPKIKYFYSFNRKVRTSCQKVIENEV